MRIHTQLSKAVIASHLGMPDDVTIHVVSEHGSRSHRTAYEVALRGDGRRHTRNPNTRDDSIPGKAATYDDWGQYLAVLYRQDASMKAGPYKNRSDFERQTKHKYV